MFSKIIRGIHYVGEFDVLISTFALFLLFLAPFMTRKTIKKIRNKKFFSLNYIDKICIATYFMLLFFSVLYIITDLGLYYFPHKTSEEKYINSYIESTDIMERNPTDFNYDKDELKYYLETLEKEDISINTDEYRRAIQYYLERLEKEENSELASGYERIIQYYLELLSREGDSKIEESDLSDIRDQISDLTLNIIDINEKIDNLNSTIELNNNKDIISSCITGICTIFAAFIAAKSVTTVVVKYKNRSTIEK